MSGLVSSFLKSRPITETTNIIEVIINNCVYVETFNNQLINIDFKDNGVILMSGELSLLGDGDDAVYRVKSPLILGLSACFGRPKAIRVRAHRNTNIMMFESDVLESLINKNNLWKDVANIIAYNYEFQQMVNVMLRVGNAMSRTINAIIVYNELQMNNEYIARFIMQCTSLSRSVVMKNLRLLNESEAILTRGGILVSMDENKLGEHLSQLSNPRGSLSLYKQ
ncbi:hypothetical protein ACLD9R_15155 [Serratia marcescens]|uniref:hypothetical protein n=1 Tax=Serratia marcescens TaxID=615 RepID=UPI00396C4E93